MSITKILSDEKTSATEKLEKIVEVVAAARKAYGNEDAEIESPMVNTVHGQMRFNHLEDDSKVEVIRGTVSRLKVEAVEFAEQTPGGNVNKKIEELLATSPIMANVSQGTKFEYL